MPPSCPTVLLVPDIPAAKPPILVIDNPVDAPGWVGEHRVALRAAVTAYGCVLVRGLGLADPAVVGAVFTALGGTLMADRESFAARHGYAQGVYSCSRWPAHQPMGMHHELSYAAEFPAMLLLACLRAATTGGATAMADSAVMLAALPAGLLGRFERQGWMLVRNYNDDIGSSITDSFGSDDRCYVEAYCRANAIEFAWQPGGGLRTWQRRHAIMRHPVSGLRCWFNQVAFLNKWALDSEPREFLIEAYGPDGLPFDTFYGNGEPISADVVELINRTYDTHTMRAPWRAGDLMVVDNIRTAHSREPFRGDREVLLAMTDPLTRSGSMRCAIS